MSVMSRGGVKKQLSRIKEVNFRVAQTDGAKFNKSMYFDIGVLAKCCEKLLQNNDELKAEIERLKDKITEMESSPDSIQIGMR